MIEPVPAGRGKDRCMCGAVVRPHAVSELAVGGERRVIERGSCRVCGLQLVRSRGAAWRQIRG